MVNFVQSLRLFPLQSNLNVQDNVWPSEIPQGPKICPVETRHGYAFKLHQWPCFDRRRQGTLKGRVDLFWCELPVEIINASSVKDTSEIRSSLPGW